MLSLFIFIELSLRSTLVILMGLIVGQLIFFVHDHDACGHAHISLGECHLILLRVCLASSSTQILHTDLRVLHRCIRVTVLGQSIRHHGVPSIVYTASKTCHIFARGKTRLHLYHVRCGNTIACTCTTLICSPHS